MTYGLGGYIGQSGLQVRFSFDSRDSILNDFEGWFIDDIVVREDTPLALRAIPDGSRLTETLTLNFPDKIAP